MPYINNKGPDQPPFYTVWLEHSLFIDFLIIAIDSFEGTEYTFSANLYKGDNFCDFLFAFLYSSPLLKGVYF